jgi:hypothetical protein
MLPHATTQALPLFVQYARQMLDADTPEVRRRELEPKLLALLPVVHALGLFELFEVRDRALGALLRDELAARRELPVAA